MFSLTCDGNAILWRMELAEAVNKSFAILEEEQARPTVRYRPVSPDASRDIYMNLYAQRQQRPRPVQESPNRYLFESINYDLLLAISNQLQSHDRAHLVEVLLMSVGAGQS